MKYEIDEIDLEILKILTSNAKISFTDLASILIISPSTVHVRVRKMEEAGIIKNFTINIDYKMLGFSFTGYLGVFLDNSNVYEKVVSELKLITQITVIDFTTGPFSVFCNNAIHCAKQQCHFFKIKSKLSNWLIHTICSFYERHKIEKFTTTSL